ncbi:acetolactate synthase [Micractinium conductrix]|uniref:Acetolactate synthase n=1 Tax=Micractinium conductrix TaxID=554055 RepID=A0A2P6VJJ2_9CHLO|nr:acetolactate synthase [Micractinium conductrix]|eukprot:PSC74230.1 acetolactate synthase [Micractinium conductrix]
MDRDEALMLFESLTAAPPHVAEHVLEAHGWEVNSAVEWYLESGGVGHGAGPAGEAAAGFGAAPEFDADAAFGGEAGFAVAAASPPDYIEEPDDEVVVEEEPEAQRPGPAALRGAAAAGRRPASRPLPASARPRSSPIEILDDDDDDIQVLASSIGRRRPNRVEELADDEPMHRVGSVEEELEVGSQGRRVRRNRRRVAGEVDRDLEVLGQRFGVMDEFAPAPAAAPRQQQQQQQQQPRGGSTGLGGQDWEELPQLPDDVDLEEQRMLMAAIQGGGYEGQLPDFENDPRFQPRVLSPGAQARQTLREEQDFAYYESLRADKEKAEAVERERREVEEAAAAAAAAAQAEARRQAEDADRLQRELSSKAASLPPEPPADDAEAVSLAVRLPAGGRYARRFRRSDPLQAVFDFVDVQSGGGADGSIRPGAYSLATSYPRRVLAAGGGQTLGDAGITARQEALFLELK